MKKVLFATTALVATAGVAAAQGVDISGSAEMGIVTASDMAGTDYDDVVVFHQSVDVRFSMTGTADNGLSFGATIDLDDLVDTGADPVDVQGDFADFNVFISGDFGTLTMGDTDGAFDWALQEVNLGSPGSIADDETAHAGYSGNGGLDGFASFDGQVLRYDYTIGGFGVAVSAEVDDENGLANEVVWGIGGRYSMDFGGGSFGVGLGYQTANDVNGPVPGDQGIDAIGVSAHVALDSGLSAAVNFSQFDPDGANNDGVHSAIGASYSMGPWAFHGNYGQFDWDAGATSPDSEGYGLAVNYDFGGGLTAHFGFGHSDVTAVNASAAALRDYHTASFGLAMSF